jgi:hypothetical protein
MGTLRDTLDVSQGGKIKIGPSGSLELSDLEQFLINGVPFGEVANVAAIASPSGASETAINGILAALQGIGLMAQSAVADLAFSQAPTNVPTGDVITPPITVQVLDDLGNFNANDQGTAITVALTVPGGATLGGTLTRSTVNGVATFDDLTVDTANTGYSLDASAGAVGPVTSATFHVVAPVATSLVFDTQPTGTHIGVVVSPAVTVKVLDQNGVLLAGSTLAITVALTTAGGATLGGTLTRSASGGIATFNNLTVNKVALYTLHATGSGVTAATSAAFQIGAL